MRIYHFALELLHSKYIMSDPKSHYNEMGVDYAIKNESNLANAFYERPAMKSLLPDLEGKSVLDAGCGSGALTEFLAENAESVVGFDLSEILVEYTRDRMIEKSNCRVFDFTYHYSAVKKSVE